MPVFNEADVLPFVLQHMREQGVRVHALDGWSTDGCYEILRDAGPTVTVERFPEDCLSNYQICRDILRRIEVISRYSDADWCMLSDCDEWRRSNVPGESLVDGIARVDAKGYNVIDHRTFAFFATDDGWSGNPETYFRHYNETDMICTLPQHKIWKNRGPVRLDAGGHQAIVGGKRLYGEKFTMKHYAFRSSAQGKRKLETRLKRRCIEEHRAGWGVHYDEFSEPDFGFLWNPAKLKEWRGNLEAPLPT